MKKLLAFSLSTLATGLALNHQPVPKEAMLSFEELCHYRGYSAEPHSLTTDDGYNLTLFHLKSSTPSTKRPILLVHGLTHSATTFIINQSAKGPAFRLADNSHDVWLLNTRGNYLSRTHKTLDPSSAEYWNFTSNDIGRYDIPATIDYILDKTHTSKINYLGHSQGGFVITFCLATRPSYNEKINLAALFAAPGGGQISTHAEYLNAVLEPSFVQGLESRGVYLIGDKTNGLNPFAQDVFEDLNKAEKYRDRYDVIISKDKPENLVVYLQQFCGGTSTTNLKYFRQLVDRNSNLLYFYDFGVKENLRRYGQEEPPLVDFGKINAKIAVFYGKYDRICSSDNGRNLLSLLKKENVVWQRLDYELDHAGFTVAPYQEHVDDLLRILDKY